MTNLLKIKYTIWLLIFCLPVLLNAQATSEEELLDTFMVKYHNINNSNQIPKLYDSLFYGLEEFGYVNADSSILWELFQNASKTTNSSFISNSLFVLLFCHQFNDRFDSLFKYSEDILHNNMNISIKDYIFIYNLRAICYHNIGIYDECLYNVMERDDLINKLDSVAKKEIQTYTLFPITNLYHATGLYHEAIIETKKHIEELLIVDPNANVSSSLNNIGLAWKNLNEPDSALHYFNLARQIILRNTDKTDSFFLNLVEGNIGSVMMMQQNYDTAIILHLKDLQTSKKRKTDEGYRGVISTQLSLAECYLYLNDNNKAIAILDSVQRYLNLVGYKKPISNYYQLKSEVFSKLGHYDSAYLYANKYVYYKDSLLELDKKTSIISMQMAFETKKKEHLISKQKAQLLKGKTQIDEEKKKALTQKKIRNTVFIALVLLLILLFIILKERSRQAKNNLILEQKNEKISEQTKSLIKVNQKLEELHQFKEAMTGMIAHDLKNPLNSIISLPVNNDNQTQKQIVLAGKRMLNIVMNLLDVSKYETSKIPMDITSQHAKSLIDNVINRISLLAESKYINIESQVNEDIFVLVDKEIIDRVFENMLTNAIKYSPVDRNVYITATDIKNGMVKFSIKDEGVGVPDLHKDKLFDKYYQFDARSSGNTRSSGLGLTFCKMAVEAHDGTIGMESQTGVMSEFWFTLKKDKVNQDIPKKLLFDIQNKEQIILSVKDHEELRVILQQLNNVEYYEFSSIRKIISSIESNQSAGISLWRNQLLNAVNSGNKERFSELISL